jgi:acetyl/propionyl-CoA carboxylase alpha subunit
VVHRAADIARAAETLRYPILVKADIGGSGAGIVRYDTPAELATRWRRGRRPSASTAWPWCRSTPPSAEGGS